MKRITKQLSSLAVACAMIVSLAGCGVSVTGVSFDIPDTLEKGSSIMATPEYAYDGETPEAAKADELVDKLGMSYTTSDPNVLTVDETATSLRLALVQQRLQCPVKMVRLPRAR